MTKRKATLSSILITLFITVVSYAAFLSAADHFSLRLPAAPAPSAGTTITAPPGYYIVTQSVDGDTFQVDIDGKKESVRLIGVDTPETHKPNTPVQCQGPEAADFTRQTLEGKPVQLVADPTNDNRDRYDRLLRYAYTQDGTLFNRLLIEKGFGFAYTSFPFQKTDEFLAAQTAAQANKVGLWSLCQAYQEKSGRWQTNPY
ncbi:MAG TPA: thermonuclease family protein [Candidatus Saccharimonadales bacterium]|nr:thermonuclease family protein [Candidatus Saccharimonadales bacterium]